MNAAPNYCRHRIDLRCVHLAPSIEILGPNCGPYSITLNPVRSHLQNGFKLPFQGEEGI